jgi:ESCRT-II complex subunit VPS25
MTEKGEFPWQHNFPPFYTLQPNLESRKKQLEAWRTIVLDYCQRRSLTSLDLREAAQSELFNNTSIQRRLTDEALRAVFKELEAKGNLEWNDKAQTRCNIYWRSPGEWGSLIYNFVKQKGATNTVCTFYELTEGPDVVGQPFHGLDETLLIKSLKTLELQKKAEIFDNNEGVKFF